MLSTTRTRNGVRQNTILNLGRHFPYPREAWPEISVRISDIINGQRQMSMFELPPEIEKAAQYYAGMIIQARGKAEKEEGGEKRGSDLRTVDINSL